MNEENEKEQVQEEQKVIENNVEKDTTEVKEESKPRKKGLCIASMILGIVALVLFCIWYISIPCGILAIIFGALGVKTMDKGMAVAGIVTGAIGLVISICIIMAIFIFGVAIGLTDAIENSTNNNYYNSYYDL